jgi:hypothetical protein
MALVERTAYLRLRQVVAAREVADYPYLGVTPSSLTAIYPLPPMGIRIGRGWLS